MSSGFAVAGRPKNTDQSFPKRLTQACDVRPDIVPIYGKGRNAVLAKKVGVSEEAVGKWFHGKTRPIAQKIARLARLLDVDESWLAWGVESDISDKDREIRNAEASGAVNLVAGL